MKWRPKSIYGKIALTAIFIIFVTLCLIAVMFRTKAFAGGLNALYIVLRPVVFGFIIAYLLNPFMQALENGLISLIAKRGKPMKRWTRRFTRFFCVLGTIVIFLVIVFLLLGFVLPELISSIKGIINNIPTYTRNLETWYDEVFSAAGNDDGMVTMINDWLLKLQDWFNTSLTPQMDIIVETIKTSVLGVLVFLKDIFIGFIIGGYILCNKESIKARFKRILYALFDITPANRILHNLRFVDKKFGGFIIGKIIDSLIIGVICYICMAIMKMPYVLLISIFIGLTNIIPVFGPFIGAIPSVILIFFVNPLQVLYFIIFVLILQQFDGNFLGPKILGSSVGISSFMVVVAIVIGSGFFGVVGMIIGVPIFAIIIALIQSKAIRSTIKKDIPSDIESYRTLWQMDPETRKPIKKTATNEKLSLYEKIKRRSEKVQSYDNVLINNTWDRTEEDIRAEIENEVNSRSFEAEWEERQRQAAHEHSKLKEEEQNNIFEE